MGFWTHHGYSEEMVQRCDKRWDAKLGCDTWRVDVLSQGTQGKQGQSSSSGLQQSLPAKKLIAALKKQLDPEAAPASAAGAAGAALAAPEAEEENDEEDSTASSDYSSTSSSASSDSSSTSSSDGKKK